MDRHVPEAQLIGNAVAIILLPGDAADLPLQHGHAGHIIERGRPDPIHALNVPAHPLRRNRQAHILERLAGHEPRPVVQGERVQIERTLSQPQGLVTVALGVVNDGLKQGPGHPLPEVIGMNIHDAQGDMVPARVIEARAHQPACFRVFRHHGAAGLQGAVHILEDLGDPGTAGKDRGQAMLPVPDIDGNID